MTQYIIFHCPRCKILLYSPHKQKTKKCTKCNKVIPLNRVKILKVTDSLKDAIFIIQRLKLPPELRQKLYESKKKSPNQMSKKEKFLEFIRKIQKASPDQAISENSFLRAGEEAGFSKEWILKQLVELEKNGLLVHHSKDELEFIL